jgi:carbon storage regulator CsrA
MGLVLTVKKNEAVFIGEEIKLLITKQYKYGKHEIKILIEAPKHIKILRESLLNDENDQTLPDSSFDQ